MFDRIRICICHPKLIGLYYKDSFLKIFSYILCLFCLFVGVCAVISYNTDHFTYEDTKPVVKLLILGSSEKKSDVVYDKEKSALTGTPVSYEADGFVVDFLTDSSYASSKKLVFCFKAETAEVLYNGFVLGRFTYEQLSAESFSVAEIQTGQIRDTVRFQDMTDILLNKANSPYGTFYLMEGISIGIIYFLIMFIIALAFSYFMNPTIAGKIRVKLTLYSISIFYVVMLFSLLFNASWLQYAALILPLIYSNITFSHIVRIEVKK